MNSSETGGHEYSILGSVVRKVNSAIQRIVIFSTAAEYMTEKSDDYTRDIEHARNKMWLPLENAELNGPLNVKTKF